MEGMGWIASIFVGGIAGWIAARVMNVNSGILFNIILGIVGASFANWALAVFGQSVSTTMAAQGFVGFLGACVLIAFVRALRGNN